MKKIFMTIVAVAAIAACSKTEVQYENSAEIGFAPAVKNVTKGAMTGDMADANPAPKLGIWAYWNYKDGVRQSSHTERYLDNATFAKKTVQISNGSSSQEITAWGGDGYAYPWPTNGTLMFAGYTIPSGQDENYSVSYSSVSDNKLTFTNYKQTSGFDLCWFGATEAINNRTSGAAIPVTLHHALSWLKFTIKGEGTTVGWKINSIVLNDIASSGTGVCKMVNSTPAKPVAEWTCNTYDTDVTLRSTVLELTADFVDIETVSSTTSNDFLVIPQTINAGNQSGDVRTQHTLTINYSFPVGANWKTDSKTVKLDLTTGTDNEWKSGFKYTYHLTFKSNEILVSPSYGGWDTTTNPGVTIE